MEEFKVVVMEKFRFENLDKFFGIIFAIFGR